MGGGQEQCSQGQHPAGSDRPAGRPAVRGTAPRRGAAHRSARRGRRHVYCPNPASLGELCGLCGVPGVPLPHRTQADPTTENAERTEKRLPEMGRNPAFAETVAVGGTLLRWRPAHPHNSQGYQGAVLCVGMPGPLAPGGARAVDTAHASCCGNRVRRRYRNSVLRLRRGSRSTQRDLGPRVQRRAGFCAHRCMVT
jgi:hypothetical protein